MLIHNDIQLDFDDVLIAPQTTTINHRGEVDIIREFKYLDVCGVPVISANMTQTGTFAVASKLLENNYFATLHKFYKADEIIDFIKEQKKKDIIFGGIDGCGEYEGNERNLFITVGKRNWNEEFKKIETIYKKTGALLSVLLDVPNAYIPEIVDCVKQLREFMDKQNFKGGLIAVGNVCSGDETQKLILAGANFVKVGIGPSCFTGQMQVVTKNGKKKIKDIQIGEEVLTHTGTYKKVVNKFTFIDNTKVMKINNIECTPNHKFLVCNKKDKDKITEENYMDYCYWCKAEELNEEKQYILKIKL